MKSIEQMKYERAQKRIKELKNWYWSIPVFVIGTLFVLGFSYFLWTKKVPDFIIIIMLLGSVLWWSFFLAKWWSLFGKKPIFLKKWEERQIYKFMQEE